MFQDNTNLISRADSSKLEASRLTQILQDFGASGAEQLGIGTEAKVYKLDPRRVLKVYADATRLNMLQELKMFYEDLDTSSISFQLPFIHEIHRKEDALVVIERLIPGKAMSASLPHNDSIELRSAYVDAVAELAAVKMRNPIHRYMLFDPNGSSDSRVQDWHKFLTTLTNQKLAVVADHLSRDVPHFVKKLELLLKCLSQPYAGPIGIIHGDIFPGNILVSNDDLAVTGIVDFGTFTMIGDTDFDVATSWAFYNMYESNHVQVRTELLDVVLARHGVQHFSNLCKYLLIYAVLSCDLYPELPGSIRETGHYRWAAEILRDDRYWSQLHSV